MEKGKVAKVIRGVYVRGVPKGEGEILRVPDDINGQEYAELKTANYIVDAEPPPDVAAKQDEAPAALLKPKKGDV